MIIKNISKNIGIGVLTLATVFPLVAMPTSAATPSESDHKFSIDLHNDNEGYLELGEIKFAKIGNRDQIRGRLVGEDIDTRVKSKNRKKNPDVFKFQFNAPMYHGFYGTAHQLENGDFMGHFTTKNGKSGNFKVEAVEIGNIVENVVAKKNLQTLENAVIAAELATALSNPDAEYTVFAPTNKGFRNIQDIVDVLLMPANKADLQEVLKYHVVPSKVLSGDLSDGQMVDTLNGQQLEVSFREDGVYINESKVRRTDILSSNGVIHIIEDVLVPATE